MHQQKKTPNLITMPARRQVICSNPLWNSFCPPSPKTSLLLFPCSKSVFLVVYNKCCRVLAHFLISSGVLIFYSSAADRPLLLAMIFSTPFYHSRKLFKRCFKYLNLRWISKYFLKSRRTLNCMQPSNTMFIHQPYTHTQRHTACSDWAIHPNGKMQPIKPTAFQRVKELWGWDNSCPWGWPAHSSGANPSFSWELVYCIFKQDSRSWKLELPWK